MTDAPAPSYPDLGDWTGKKPTVTPENEVFVDLAESLAWSTMIRLSGYMVVVQPTVVHPLCELCSRIAWGSRALDWLIRTDVMIVDPLGRFVGPDFCGCGHRSIALKRPVGRVVEVKIDGAVLDRTAYAVEGNRLVRTDGGVWPTQQNPAEFEDPTGNYSEDYSAEFEAALDGGTVTPPSNTPDTPATALEITYYAGHRPDTLFVWATGQLAFEFFLSIAPSSLNPGKSKCRLPSGVTSIVRQGVSYEIEQVPFTNGHTGIVEIDAVLSRYNPNGLTARPSVVSADTLRRTMAGR